MAATIQIKGLDKLEAKLGNITPGVRAGIKAATLHVKGKIAVYPPATMANKAKTWTSGGNNTWYERGWGSKWALKAGGWHGKKSSEELPDQWKTTTRNNGMTGVIGNKVTYARYVHDPDEQAAHMKRIGWKTTGDVAEQEAETVTQFIKAQIDRALSSE